jgi:hypothetical protein
MTMSKVNAYAASRPHPMNILPNNSQALPQNGDGIKDVPSQPSPPVKPMGKVGTIINVKV